MGSRQEGSQPGDVVLVHIDDAPAGYARIEELRSHPRPGWFECDLVFLGVPLQPVTWILEREQIDGVPFTMGGRPVRIEPLPPLGGVHRERRAQPPEPSEEKGATPPGDESRGDKVVPQGRGDKVVPQGRGDKVVPLVRKKR